MLLFDLIALQPIGSTANHGGKEYGEAVLFEIMRRQIPISGIYDSKNDLNKVFIDYCKEKGELIDVNECSLQEAIDSGKYTSFYSAIPYSYSYLDWKNVKFYGNIHGLRDIEALTDKYEYLYAQTIYQKIVAYLKRFGFVRKTKISHIIKGLKTIIYNPNFICITGSEHSKHAIMVHFPQKASSDIHVFFDPLIIENPSDDVKNEFGRYYLLVSGNRWLKNTYRGVKALDELISSGQINCKVVVTGVTGNLPWLKKVKNKNNFIFKGYVSAKELASLFKNAYSLIFLSLSEGFGYPPLESISRGVPVICSPLTALYEVYQNGVLYCNPLSVDDIKAKVLSFEEPAIYEKYVLQSQIRYREMNKLQDEDLVKLVDVIIS